jgi:hypothetical protein
MPAWLQHVALELSEHLRGLRTDIRVTMVCDTARRDSLASSHEAKAGRLSLTTLLLAALLACDVKPADLSVPPLAPGALPLSLTQGEWAIQALPSPLSPENAEKTLSLTDYFDTGDTRRVEAFHVLLEQTDAVTRFRSLAANARWAGQLYALCALRTLAPEDAQRLHARLTSVPDLVSGHGGHQRPVAEFVRDDYGLCTVVGATQVAAESLDPALPRVAFGRWLRDVVGAEATMWWESTDCGEQSGDSAQDTNRDFPMCADVRVNLSGQRILHVSLVVGTLKTGVVGTPAFRRAELRMPDGTVEAINTLPGIPSAIR